jgi:chromosome partitioning protein
MKTITICQRKGGVGKSTATLNLACVFGELGYKVLIVDLDDQQNTTKSISAIVEGEKTIEDLLLKEDVKLKDAVVESSWKNVFILPASSNLSGVVKYLDGEVGGHLILKEKLNDESFDFVLIDTSPSLNILVLNALCASQYMFIPLSSKYLSLQGLKQTIDAFKKVAGRLNPELKLLGIGFVNHDKRNVLANEVVDQVFNNFKDEVLKTMIGINIKIEEAQVKKESIISQYRELGKEILLRLEK